MTEHAGVKRLTLTMPLQSEVMVANPVLLYDGDQFVLVDTGMPGQLEAIKQSLANEGLVLEDLDAIIFTHQDIDHIGNLPAILTARGAEGLKLIAHPADKPYIDGSLPLLKFSPQRNETLLKTLSEEDKQQFLHVFSPSSPDNVNELVEDGQFLAFGGGVTVIHSPGHTPGHISLYHHASHTLITGDAMVVVDGQLMGPEPRPTLDMEQAMQSLHKFTAFDIHRVICFHGGSYEDNPNERILQIIESYE